MMVTRILALLTLGAMTTLTGCGSDGYWWSDTTPDAQAPWVQQLAALQYPGEPEQLGAPLDVVVEPEDHHLVLINRTARRLSSVQVWVNQQFVTVLETLEPGDTVSLPLNGFINQYGESFPTGSFLRPDRRQPLVSADVYDPSTGQLHNLTVRTRPDIFGN